VFLDFIVFSLTYFILQQNGTLLEPDRLRLKS